jgi:transglutaminase-like putative cysteine protease
MEQEREGSREFKDSLQFLLEYMPETDKGVVSEAQLSDHARLALRARNRFSWARDVPWKIFLNEVLPYRSLDEPYDHWRPDFFDRFAPMVEEAASITEAAMILNRDIWSIWGLVFKSDQAPEILSPSQVIQAGYGSCSALSIFLVDACRAVGIPARVAGKEGIAQGGFRSWGLTGYIGGLGFSA